MSVAVFEGYESMIKIGQDLKYGSPQTMTYQETGEPFHFDLKAYA